LHCSVGHDARIGSYCQLSSYSDVTGHVQLADEVFMGSHASILPSVSVGDRAVVGAGSVVISKVKPGTTVMGVPAKPL
jgi:acetyltransferase-like isoleucine patch superfamily enzyme